MLSIFPLIMPVFLLIGLGFAVGRAGVLTPEQVRGLGRFVISIALPALVFQSLHTRRLHDILRWDYLAVYAVASLGAFGIVLVWSRSRGVSQAKAAVRAFGAGCSNSGFVGTPIVLQMFGEAGALPIALNMLVENALVIPLALSLLHAAESRSASSVHAGLAILVKLSRSPLLLAIATAMLCSWLALPVPQIVDRPIALLAAGAAPVALIAIGAGLAPASAFLNGQALEIAVVAAGKLALHPLLVAALLFAVPVGDPVLRLACIVLAGMPMASVFPIIAQLADDESFCGSVLLVGTVLSFLTLSVVICASGAGAVAR